MNHRPSGYEPDELPTAPPRDESWWMGLDSNQRSETRQIYSLLPLTTREPIRLRQKELYRIQAVLSTHFLKFICIIFLSIRELYHRTIFQLGKASPDYTLRTIRYFCILPVPYRLRWKYTAQQSFHQAAEESWPMRHYGPARQTQGLLRRFHPKQQQYRHLRDCPTRACHRQQIHPA